MLSLLLLLLACQAPEPEPLRHTVARGDTLSKIAQRYSVSVDQLREWNGLQGDRIEVGQVILILADAPAPAPEQKARRPNKKGGGAPAGPKPEPCVPFAPELGDEGMAAPEGLDRATVKAGLDAVLPLVQGCPFLDGPGRKRVVFELVIGCDGLVRSAEVSDDDGASPEAIACARDALRLADFPAHDMADGMPVTYPLTIEID